MGRHDWTDHARWRSATRAISNRAIDYVLSYGQCFWAGRGCHAYFLGKRTVKRAKQRFDVSLEAFKNIAVIVAEDGTLVTVEHCTKPPRHWKPR
jgi:hypothetical protein